jgi:hypothetical protein
MVCNDDAMMMRKSRWKRQTSARPSAKGNLLAPVESGSSMEVGAEPKLEKIRFQNLDLWSSPW